MRPDKTSPWLEVKKLASTLGFAACLVTGVSVFADTPALNPVKDNTLFEDSPTFSNGIGSYTFVGPIASGSPRRTLWQFDISTIPAGSQILSASLLVVVSRAAIGSSPDDTMSLHRVNASWGEGSSEGGTGGGGTQASAQDATWAYRFYGNPGAGIAQVPWAVPGGDYQAAASAQAAMPGTGSITLGPSPALIADVSAWVNNPADNHGWIAIGPEGPNESQKARRLVSRESPSTADRPQLTVEYAPFALQTRSTPALPPAAAAIFAALLAAIAHKRRIG